MCPGLRAKQSNLRGHPMADLTPRERLQPSLLDRLTDDKPSTQKESRDSRVLSLRQLRESVVRDLGWLLNTSAHRSAYDNLDDYPQVQSSVVNFGIPDMTGLTSSSIDQGEIERFVMQAIRDFEPRVMRNTLHIRVKTSEDMDFNALTFEIDGELWSQPIPEPLYLKTSVDLESGQYTVEERFNG